MIHQTKKEGSGLESHLAGVFCYLGFFMTGIIFLLIEPKDEKEVRFHAWQSIFFSGALVVFFVVFKTILSFFLWIDLLWFHDILRLICFLVGMAFFSLWMALMIRAYQGFQLRLPVVTELAEKQLQK